MVLRLISLIGELRILKSKLKREEAPSSSRWGLAWRYAREQPGERSAAADKPDGALSFGLQTCDWRYRGKRVEAPPS